MNPLLLIFLAILAAPVVGAVWTARDASQRRMVAPAWAAAVFVLFPLAFPIYLGVRALKPGETREGGRPWNVLRNFALLWTALVAVFVAALLAPVLSVPSSSAAGRVGQFASYALVGGIVWIGPMLAALLLGVFLRKPGLVERGS